MTELVFFPIIKVLDEFQVIFLDFPVQRLRQITFDIHFLFFNFSIKQHICWFLAFEIATCWIFKHLILTYFTNPRIIVFNPSPSLKNIGEIVPRLGRSLMDNYGVNLEVLLSFLILVLGLVLVVDLLFVLEEVFLEFLLLLELRGHHFEVLYCVCEVFGIVYLFEFFSVFMKVLLKSIFSDFYEILWICIP